MTRMRERKPSHEKIIGAICHQVAGDVQIHALFWTECWSETPISIIKSLVIHYLTIRLASLRSGHASTLQELATASMH